MKAGVVSMAVAEEQQWHFTHSRFKLFCNSQAPLWSFLEVASALGDDQRS